MALFLTCRHRQPSCRAFDDPFAAVPGADLVFGPGRELHHWGCQQGWRERRQPDVLVSIATDEAYMNIYVVDQGNNRVSVRPAAAQSGPCDLGTLPRRSAGWQRRFRIGDLGRGHYLGHDGGANGAPRPVQTDPLGVIIAPIGAAEIAQPGAITFTLANPGPGGGISAPMTLTVYVPAPGDTTAWTAYWGRPALLVIVCSSR